MNTIQIDPRIQHTEPKSDCYACKLAKRRGHTAAGRRTAHEQSLAEFAAEFKRQQANEIKTTYTNGIEDAIYATRDLRWHIMNATLKINAADFNNQIDLNRLKAEHAEMKSELADLERAIANA